MMRGVYPCDLDRAAQVVMRQEAEAQKGFAKTLVWRAQIADKYRKRLGRNHPQFGSGTLSGAAGVPIERAPDRCNDAYLQALKHVITALVEQP